MSSFFSAKYLKYRPLAASGPKPVTGDVYCPSCGYSLRGLDYGRNCPECATLIKPPGSGAAADIMLTDTPAQRQRWRVGLALASRALLTVLVARLGLFAAMLLLPSAWTPSVYFAIGWVASLAWITGVWLITPPALDYGLQWRRRLRIAVRCSQLLWIVGYALWTLAHELSGTALEPTLWRLALVCRGVAGVGGLALAALLLRVAEEAGLENGARRLNAAVWLLPLPTLILALVPAQVAWFALILIFGVLLAWGWFLWLYARGLLEMQRHLTWSMRETTERQTRDQRVAETRNELERQVRLSIRPPPATEPDIPREGRTIAHDEPCGKCGYNLRGVRYGGVCPECGSPIVRRHSPGDALRDAPLREIKRIRLGIWVAMACLPALVLAALVAAIFRGDPVALAWGLGVSGVWVGAVWLMTPPIDAAGGVRHGFGPSSPLRVAVQGAQVGWPLACALSIAAWQIAPAATAGSLTALNAAAALALLIGMTGLVLLAVLLGRLAHWCYDDLAGRLLEWTLWGLSICILVLLLAALLPGARFLAGIFSVFLLASLGCLILGLFFLGRSVTWSAHHATRQADRDRALRRPTDRGLRPGADERGAIPLAPPRRQSPPIEPQPRGP